MPALSQAYFDKHYKELIEFLGVQFSRVAGEFSELRSELSEFKDETRASFGGQTIKLEFIRSDIEQLKKDIAAVSRRTREDDDAFMKELVKLKTRVAELEKRLKKMKVKSVA